MRTADYFIEMETIHLFVKTKTKICVTDKNETICTV